MEKITYANSRYRDPCEAHLLQRYQAIGDLRLPRPLRLGEAARFDSCSAPLPSAADAGWMQRVLWAQRLAAEPSRQADYQRLLEGVWYGYAEDVPTFFSSDAMLPAPRLYSTLSVPGVDEGTVPEAPVVLAFGVVAVAVDRLLDAQSALARGVDIDQHRELRVDDLHRETLAALAAHRDRLSPEQCLVSESGAMLLRTLLDSPLRRDGYIQLCGSKPVRTAWQALIEQRSALGSATLARRACRDEFGRHFPTAATLESMTAQPAPPKVDGSPLPIRRLFAEHRRQAVQGDARRSPEMARDRLIEAACADLDALPFVSTDFLHELTDALSADVTAPD